MSNGALEGIIIMWDKRVVELRDHYVGEYLVACHFKSEDDGFEWAFARVLWSELAQ